MTGIRQNPKAVICLVTLVSSGDLNCRECLWSIGRWYDERCILGSFRVQLVV